ncbi:SLAM family member 5-like isoform X2 [Acipenser ruthenus]|uniref:SLAM family member 5-like isoform X2 n=1 Tax=Acipenser ruthenus TaxID=7906 RepID=UPI0027424C71|nr:SLAM family member 5-like isoform X2 [Acipenser ruthenus]XP_058877638.1 SLAM family member 5-like isoform X2 [Acipenser ruthenus]
MSAHRRLLYFSYELPVFILLLGLLVASSVSADPVVNRIVGESVVLLAGLSPQDNPSELEWRLGKNTIADKDNSEVTTDQFRHRLHLNRTDWSLTINLLRAEDSGEYNRVATAASGQLPTHTVTLHVYEKIESEVTRKPSHETCRATLLCTTNQREHISYRWKRGDQDLPEHAGILEVSLNPGEINVIFTCIASNPVSEAAASIWESCADTAPWWLFDWRIYAGTAGILLLVLVSIVVLWQKMKKKHNEAVTEPPQQPTIYAEIQRKTTQRNHVKKSSNAQQSDSLPTTVYATVNLKQVESSANAQQSDGLPMTVYETVDHKRAPGKSCDTQYDMVNFNRNKENTPYQHIL